MRTLVSRVAIAFLYGISYLPLPLLYLCSNVVSVLLFDVFRVRRSITITNLTRSFPEKSKREIREIARRYYLHLSDLAFEVIKSLTITSDEIRRRCLIEDLDLLNGFDEDQRGVVAILGHYGNWEWAALASALSVRQPMVVIYKPLGNPVFDSLFRKMRERFGVQMVAMKDVGRHYVRSRDTHFVNCFVADQAPRRAEVAYWTEFLHQDTPIHLGAEKIAVKYDHVAIFVSVRKRSRGHYVVNMENIETKPMECEEYSITERHVRKLEDLIRECPDYWLWSHRRWKRKRASRVTEENSSGSPASPADTPPSHS